MIDVRLAADTLVTNARVRTMDARGTVASAVVVKNGRFLAVGTEDELRPLTDGGTEVIDAGGRTVLPGFIETHAHFHKGALAKAYQVDWGPFNRPASLAEALDDIRRHVAKTPAGEWVRGEGLMPHQLPERRMPDRLELDAVSTEHPIVLITGPNVPSAANSLALKMAGIERDTPDPPGGLIERDADGEPTGILEQKGKLRLDPRHPESVLPRYSAEDRIEPVKSLIETEVLPAGITSVHDMVSEPEEVATWIKLRRTGELAVRVQLLVRGIVTRTPLEHILGLGLEHGLGDEWLRFGGVKMSIDGVCAYRSAAVYDPYPGQPDNTGVLHIPADVLDAGVAACHQAGVRLIIHAVGQRAVDMALDALDKAGDPRPELRHRLEHVHLPPRPGQLERIAAAGYTVGAQPSFIWKHGQAWLDIWGVDGTAGIMPLRSMLDAGIHVFGGTDCFGTPISPFLAFRTALARLTRDGKVLDAGEAITIDEALRMWTSSAAWAAGEEHEKGSIEIGKVADLIILSEDPHAVPADELDRIKVDLTMVSGRVSYVRS